MKVLREWSVERALTTDRFRVTWDEDQRDPAFDFWCFLLGKWVICEDVDDLVQEFGNLLLGGDL